jgi:hypothetical protein
MSLISKGFFAVSKNVAASCFRPVFGAKTSLSTGPGRKAINRFQLSPPTVHFCTFYVDKIVSKAQVTNPSH